MGHVIRQNVPKKSFIYLILTILFNRIIRYDIVPIQISTSTLIYHFKNLGDVFLLFIKLSFKFSHPRVIWNILFSAKCFTLFSIFFAYLMSKMKLKFYYSELNIGCFSLSISDLSFFISRFEFVSKRLVLSRVFCINLILSIYFKLIYLYRLII